MTHALIAPGCQLQGGRVDRAMLSPGVWVEAEAEVQGTILVDGVPIGREAQVRHSIIDRETLVPSGTRIGCDPATDDEPYRVSEGYDRPAVRPYGTGAAATSSRGVVAHNGSGRQGGLTRPFEAPHSLHNFLTEIPRVAATSFNMTGSVLSLAP